MSAYPKKWCISWINFFDNTLNMEFCYATSEQHALEQAYEKLMGIPYDSEDNPDIRCAAFDCDGMIEAIEVE